MQEVGLVEKSAEDSSFYMITQKGIKYRNHFNSFVNMMEEDLSKISTENIQSKEFLKNIKIRIRS